MTFTGNLSKNTRNAVQLTNLLFDLDSVADMLVAVVWTTLELVSDANRFR